ncbi:LysM peptidoglycan-binding domain-containing protein [Mesobacillus maritimus]|uniref:C40 family peptidase n=1 Tax=Mesobacillus maritimus TaxID=1643336 RepID=UPI00203DFD24|nr:peptidoglycan endopeptidase [Mesobacillus maritimus]MCM3670884.1 LysM peptidoglycan-binding domain-containing protein [Mesobacillus maritimus]
MKKKVTTLATAAILSSAFASTAFADTYTVKKGDTLSHIARNYSISVPQLKNLNGLSSDLIFPNQKLKVSKTSTTTSSSDKRPATTTTNTSSSSTAKSTYTIVSGDTLSGIASKHKTTVAKLKSWNNLKSDLIFPGQKLKVSASGTSSSTTTVAAAPSTSSSTTAANPASTSTYKIKSGDTLGKIASQFRTTVNNLKALNNLSSDLIYAGQTLKVSGQASSNTVVQASTTQTVKTEVASASNDADQLISIAKSLLGTPYAWGGSSPSGFDCSGFIYYAYKQAGYDVSRTSAEGYFGRSYYVDKPAVGDLVFFENTYKKGISHVGIYLGNNQFIHAGNDKVEISSLNNSYYKKHFDSFKRFY